MTTYSTPPQPSPNGSGNPNPDTELDSLDWESRMAKLVGLEEQSQHQEPTSEATTNPQPPAVDPQEVQTESSLSSNPFAKVALVGTGTLILVMFAGIFLMQIMSGTSKRSTNQVIAPSPSPQATPTPRLQQLETEVETLKTKLALAQQAEDVQAAQQQLRRLRTTPSPQVTSKPTPTPQTRTPTPTRTVYVTPPPVVRERVVRVPVTVPQPVAQTQKPTPSPLPIPPQPPVTFTPTTPPPLSEVNPPSPPDPLQEWNRLAKLGSYGQITANNNTSSRNTISSSSRNTEDEDEDKKTPTVTQPKKPSQGIITASSPRRRSGKSTVVGSSARGVLATAVFGETTRSSRSSSSQNSNNNVFVVRLTEPLKTADGDIALPENTELFTQVSSISQQGLVQLDITKVILQQDNGRVTQKSIPKNAMVIRAPGGEPLIADKYPNQSGSIAGMDAGMFVLGGLGKAAELYNRTESQVTTTPTGTVVTNSNPRRNILAGVLEGGMKTVVPQISRRNQRAISEMMKRTDLWFMEAGTDLEVYVNESISL